MQIDWWTLALQAINFLVLVWLLQRFLYKPVQAVIARRREQTESVMAEARATQSKAEQHAEALEHERRELAAERDRGLEDAHAQARKEHEEMLERAREETRKMTEETREHLAAERRDARRAVRGKATGLGVDIARKLLARAADGHAPDHLFFDEALAALDAMPADKRAELRREAGAKSQVRVVTASPLPPKRADELRGRLADVLGGGVNLSFADDTDLIAGIELHFPHTVLRHSWRDDLNRVLEELGHNEQDG